MRKYKKYKIYFLIIVFWHIQFTGNANKTTINTPLYIFFKKTDILIFGINTILIKNPSGNNWNDCDDCLCSCRDSLNCERIFVFENGKIINDICYDGYQEKGDIMNIDEYDYNFYNTDSISIRYLNFEYGAGQMRHARIHQYRNNKLISFVDKHSYCYMVEPYEKEYYECDDSYDNFHQYFYDLDGKLSYCTMGHIEKNDTIFESNIYFLYRNNHLIGYYPSKTEYFNGKWEKSDTIYHGRKIEELEKIGFEKFSEKYFHGEVLKKIIGDCYGPIKNEQLLINGKPIRDFLLSIGRADVRYIIFEVTDNYFLFYKIID